MNSITITSNINAPINKVWEFWIKEEHIKNWNFASPEWHCPNAINNLIKGGEFHYTMAAKDNSMSFDFWGTYQNIEPKRFIEILLGDARKMSVLFEETENSIELQQVGWQMILDNFKRYTENQL